MTATSDLHIDVVVHPRPSRVVFNLDHTAFAGGEPIGLKFIRLMRAFYVENDTRLEAIAIFHGAMGYLSLNDAAYDRDQKTSGGNPYKTMIAAEAGQGTRFEVCAQTARENGWVNADFLPEIAVNSGANLRLVQLVQEGFVAIQP